MRALLARAGVGFLFIVSAGSGAQTPRPLAPIAGTGSSVTPAFEGWYRNPDGTFSISFGYLNRNSDEDIDIPVGDSNFVAPGPKNQGQPTHFEPRRNWGVFAVKVPADFGTTKTVTWTIRYRGEIYAIPGHLRPEWEIDALAGEVGSGNTPPMIKFAPAGPEARGPGGYTAGPLSAVVGQPLAIKMWEQDDGRSVANPAGVSASPPAAAAGTAATGRGGRAGRGAAAPSTTLAWFLHQGPAAVTFSSPGARAAAVGDSATMTATFSAAGEYILRVRATDGVIASAGHAQCCWTNAFVKVVVK